MDRERGAGYYNFYLIFVVFVSTRRERERLLLLLLGCSSFLYLSLGRMERRHLFPPCDSYLIGRWNSLGICLRHFFSFAFHGAREITNSLSSAQQLTRRKALGEIKKKKKTFFLSFFFFRKSQISCSSPPALFLRLLFVCYSFISSFHQYRSSREETAGVSVCVCVPTQSFFFFFLKIKKENLK